jgi:N-acetylneuraminate synthase/N,N'-diacetyllegionaminate synthase
MADVPGMGTDATAAGPWFAEATAAAAARVMVIAELGVNHDGQVALAERLVDAAADAGADAVKVQLFHPDRLLSNQSLLASYQQSAAEDPRALLGGLALGVAQLRPIAARARRRGLRFLVTPFSLPDVEDLAALDADAIKIASPDAVNLPLLEACATLGRPLLISTGTCTLDELAPAAMRLREHAPGGALLHCVSSYPTPRGDAALGAIRVMREAFGLPIGYSDHTPDLDTGALAVAGGAIVLEKHLTHDKAAPGPDHAASITPEELRDYIRRAREAAAMLGPAAKRVLPIEADVQKVSRQSLCATRDLPAGHTLGADDLTIKRPGTGLPAARLAATIGRTLARPVAANDLLGPDDLA